MKIRSILFGIVLISVPFMNSCKNGENSGQKSESAKDAAKAESMDKQIVENRKKIDQLNHTYPNLPVEGKLLQGGMNPCYDELQQRYKSELTELKQKIESTGAKMTVIFMTVFASGKTNASETIGLPFVKKTCAELGLDALDLGPVINSYPEMEFKQLPKDAHWSKKGAKIIADQLATIVKKYPDVASKVAYKDNERSETFGDLPPNDDEVLDGSKDMPYHVKANSQGVRMDHDLTFPKKKKRVLILGDSGIFCPFLDNDFTISYCLQQQLPDYEVFAISNVSWTVEDFLTIWNEKAKYTEPDIVIVQTNGNDIEDLFFTHRNRFSRSGKPFYPSPIEEKFYNDNYKQAN